MQINAQQLEQFVAKLPEKKLSLLLLAIMVVYIAFLTAQTFWLLWPQPQTVATYSANTTANTRTNQSFDVNALTSQNLFGDAVAIEKDEPEVVINDAPETSLNISLTGVVAVNHDDKAGLAIIESQGQQNTYSVGEQVEGTQARIEQILADRVIIKVRARFETLMLDGIDFTRQVAASRHTPAVPKKPAIPKMNADLKQELKAKRRELLAEPGKLFEYIRISPKRVSGEIVGYSLNPGKDPKLFTSMGLKSNDLAISINGYMLTDMQQAMSAIKELRSASSATIVIDRDGKQQDVLFSLE